MSLAKTVDGMHYELTGTKKVKNSKTVAVKTAEQLSTSTLVWLLVKRHKVGLLMIGNALYLIQLVLPEWPNFVKSIFY